MKLAEMVLSFLMFSGDVHAADDPHTQRRPVIPLFPIHKGENRSEH